VVEAWVTNLLHGGAEANTARIRQQAVRRFGAWLTEEEMDGSQRLRDGADIGCGLEQPGDVEQVHAGCGG
jgi:hypothetical protein